MAVAIVPTGSGAHADTVDGAVDGVGRLQAGAVFDLLVVGRGGVPSTGVDSVALNITVTNPWEPGFLTVWPTGEPRPTASNLNFVRAQTVPNMVVTPVGAGGQVSLYLSAGSSDVIVDVLGWFPTEGGFTSLTPARLLDGRAEGVTIDGAMQATGKLRAGSTFDLPVRGRGGVASTGVGSVVLNVTVIGASDATYLTAWPSGTPRPTASNANVVPGETRANMVIVPLGASGDVSLYLYSGTADVVVDVMGWFPSGGSFTGVSPSRLMDSRSDGVTVDGSMRASGALVGGRPVDLAVAGRAGLPAGSTTSVALNVTVTDPIEGAFVTVHPAGTPRPNASNLNVIVGQTVPNMVLVPLGADGKVTLYLNRGSAHVVVDVLGYVTGSATFVGVTPARLLETRGLYVHVPLPEDQRPQQIEFDGSSMWITGESGSLHRFDLASGTTESVPVPGQGGSVLLFDGRYLWLDGGSEGVRRLDPVTRQWRRFALPSSIQGVQPVGADATNLWVISNGDTFVRINRSTGAVRLFRLGESIFAGVFVFDGRSIWWPKMFGGELGRFDTRTQQASTVPLPSGHTVSYPAIAFDGSRLWVHSHIGANTFDPPTVLTWLDPVTLASGDIALPDALWDSRTLVAIDDSIWISSPLLLETARVNVTTGVTTLLTVPRVLDPQPLGRPRGAPRMDLVSDGTNIWMLNSVYSFVTFPKNI